MISTATALTSAWARRGSGPQRLHAMKARIATPTTAGTKVRRDLIGQPLNWGATALRFATMRTICASSVSLPTR